jgi:hypothetical protein
MARYDELQKALADRQQWAKDLLPTRERQAVAVVTLMRQLREAVADELGLVGEDRWRNVWQSNGRDFNDDEPDVDGHAIYTTLTDHRVCLNVRVLLADDPPRARPRGHIAWALLVFREIDGSRHHVAVEGVGGTFAEVDVDANDPSSLSTFAKAFTSAVVEFYASRLNSNLESSGRNRIGFQPTNR